MKKEWQKIDMLCKKIKAINYLGGKCIKCGDDNIFHLSFHHLTDKDFTISQIKTSRFSKIKKEIEKCELLCENCHMEKHYNENIENTNEHRRKSKLIYLKYKGEKCEKCGYDKCAASLSFHHRDSKNKLFCIGSLGIRINSIAELKDNIIDELDKCDVLCRNCHIEEHSDIEFFEEFKEEIYNKVENSKYIERQCKISREEIIKMYNSGIKQVDIAKHYNASKSTISGIINKLKNNGDLPKW